VSADGTSNIETLPRFVSLDDTPHGIKIVLDIDVPDPEYPVATCTNDYSGISLAVQTNRARARICCSPASPRSMRIGSK